MKFDEYMSIYCEAESMGAELPSDIKQYIDDRLKELDRKDTTNGISKYNVVPSFEKGRLLVIDVENGSVVGNIDTQGTLISVPVVYGDSVSFAVQDADGRVTGSLRDLPDGNVLNVFRVSSPRPGMKYKEVMGREDEPSDEVPPSVEPTEVPKAPAEIKKFVDNIVGTGQQSEKTKQDLDNLIATIDSVNLKKLEDDLAGKNLTPEEVFAAQGITDSKFIATITKAAEAYQESSNIKDPQEAFITMLVTMGDEARKHVKRAGKAISTPEPVEVQDAPVTVEVPTRPRIRENPVPPS